MSLGQKHDISQMFALFFNHERPRFDHHMIDKAGSQATIDRLEEQLRELKRKVGRYKTRLTVAQLKKRILDIGDQISRSLPSPRDCIFCDLVNNHQVPANRDRHSIKTLIWGRMVDGTSPTTWETVRSMLP
jgi:hypothetical protein